jgi:DNA-binding response OmpR family regulator
MARGRLLLVEDEDDMLEVLARYLQGLGYEVHCATSVEAARGIALSLDSLDAAIVDWSLPDGCGRDVITGIRTLHPHCCFVVTTGHGASVVSEAQGSGLAGSVMRKPYTMRSLYQRVATLLEQAGVPG